MGKPLGNIIVVKPFEKEMSIGNIVLTTDNQHMPEKGRVISVGDGIINKSSLKAGVDILFRKGANSLVNIDGEDLLLMEEKAVYYIL